MAEAKKVKDIKMKLKLRKRHPHKSLRLGRHVIKVGMEEFELNAKEQKELESKGCKAWVISEKEMEEAAAKKKKQKEE